VLTRFQVNHFVKDEPEKRAFTVLSGFAAGAVDTVIGFVSFRLWLDLSENGATDVEVVCLAS